MSEDPVCRHLSLRDLCPDCIRAAVARIGEPDEQDAPSAFEDQGTMVTGPVRMIRGHVVDRDGERYDPSESEGRACCVECHAEIVVYPEECGMLPEELDGDRHASHTWRVCELSTELRRMRPTYLGSGHPWGDFLHHRARAMRQLRDELGHNAEQIAAELSMRPDQVLSILRHVDATPADYPPEVPR